MAFKGDLSNISLFDVFQTLSQNKQSGVLVLARDGTTKKIYISPDGVRIFFTRSFRTLRLGEIFVRRGLITQQDVEILLMEQKKEYRPFGQILAESGKVPRHEIDAVLRYHAEDEIFEIFGWESGTFSFFDGQDAGDSATPLSDILMDPAGLCLEAARRLDEMERLRQTLPSDNEFLRQVDEVEPEPDSLLPAVRDLYDALTTPSCIDDLRDLVGLSFYDAMKAVSSLLEAGLIRLLTVEELLDAGRRETDAGRFPQAARLFETAHKRVPDDRAVLEECVAVVERLGQPRRLAGLLSQLGALSLQDGAVDEAVEYLELTLRHDASHVPSLVALRDAFQQQGDRERVAEMSLRIARNQAEGGNLDAAVESCRLGLESAPRAVALRFFYAQLLARTDHVFEAREAVHEIIRDTENARRTLRAERATELLTSCYRLLLKIDPNDNNAQDGLESLERKRRTSLRKQRFVLRGGVAAALLLVAVGVGITVMKPGPEELLARIEKERADGNTDGVLELINKLMAEHPDSPQTRRALDIRKEISQRLAAAADARRSKEKRLLDEATADFNEVRDALDKRSYVEAVERVEPFLARLDRPEFAFLRKNMGAQIEYELISFCDKVAGQYETDRQQVTSGAIQLEQHERDAAQLGDLETRLARIRQRDWPQLVPELFGKLGVVAASPHVGKGKQAVEELREKLAPARASFGSLDTLYFAVRRQRLKVEVEAAVREAKQRGVEHLRECELAEARRLFDNAWRKADAVASEEPREQFTELLQWLDRRRILDDMRTERDKIDEVMRTLGEVEILKKEGGTEAAYRLLRDLVAQHMLIQFEKKYRMPYRVTSVPGGASVLRDGVPIGNTPCDIEMEIGNTPVRLSLRRAGFEEARRQIVPTDPSNDGLLRVHMEKRALWSREAGGAIEAPPVLADGKLLLATNRATLLALDLETGATVWEADPEQLDRIVAAPLVLGDFAVFATVGGMVYRVHLRGESAGKLERPGIDVGGQVLTDGVVVGDTLYLATRRSRLVAIRGREVLYSIPMAHTPTTPVVHLDGKLFVGTAEGAILVHDAKTGLAVRTLKNPTASSFFGGLAVHAPCVLGGAEDGHLYAFLPDREEPLWSYDTRSPVTARIASEGSLLYLPARDGYVHALTAEGAFRAKYDVGSGVESRPALDNGFLYALGSNRIHAFDTKDNLPWWDRSFEGEFPQHVLAGEGHIVVITNKPWIHCFAKDLR